MIYCSRGDAFFGDDHTFNPFIYGQTKSYFLQDTIDIPTGAKARLARVNTAKAMNPSFHFTDAGLTGSFTETCFYLSVIGDPVTGIAQTNWVNIFFGKLLPFLGIVLELMSWNTENERLPYAEGWTRRESETNLTSLGIMAKKVMAATPAFSLPPGF
jgi:hypothetical protein